MVLKSSVIPGRFWVDYLKMFYEHLKELMLSVNLGPLRASSFIQQIFVVYLLDCSPCARH